MRTMDQLNTLYGRKTLFFASEGLRKAWGMKQEKMTQAYTTKWDELPMVQ